MKEFPNSVREVRLKSHPIGLPTKHDFTVEAVSLHSECDRPILVKNLYTRISASIRMMITAGASDVPGVPFPSLRPGDILAEESLGVVVSAPEIAHMPIGALVVHHRGFREFSCLARDECRLVDDCLPDRAAHLSHGWTAYAALTNGANLVNGETVLITNAGGAIGSMAGQIARRLGAGRIVGTAGSEEKARRLEKDCGYDAVVVRSSHDFSSALHSAAPCGVDVMLDSVGGEQLKAGIDVANERARIVLAGALSGQLAPTGVGRAAPVSLDSFPIILKRLQLVGYSADDDSNQRGEWEDRLAEWLNQELIRFPSTRFSGIETAPEAIEAVVHGQTFGTVILAY